MAVPSKPQPYEPRPDEGVRDLDAPVQRRPPPLSPEVRRRKFRIWRWWDREWIDGNDA